jgi:hypothetical protein
MQPRIPRTSQHVRARSRRIRVILKNQLVDYISSKFELTDYGRIFIYLGWNEVRRTAYDFAADCRPDYSNNSFSNGCDREQRVSCRSSIRLYTSDANYMLKLELKYWLLQSNTYREISDQYGLTSWQASCKNDAWGSAHYDLRWVSPIAPTLAASLGKRRPLAA